MSRRGAKGSGPGVASLVGEERQADRSVVADAYDRDADGFARAADRYVYAALAAPLVAAVVEAIGAPGGPVLDVAAGAGAFGRAFRNVVACDIAAGQLAANPAARRVRCDARQLPFGDGSFAAAGCAFGINHVCDPVRVVAEMARVAPVVGVSTWVRPEAAYAPKRIVSAALEQRCGRSRSPAGELLDRLSEDVGSVEAVRRVLRSAGVAARVEAIEVEVPWPGVDAYLDYRLGMPTTPHVASRLDVAALRDELAGAVAALPPEALTWRPRIIVGTGSRPCADSSGHAARARRQERPRDGRA